MSLPVAKPEGHALAVLSGGLINLVREVGNIEYGLLLFSIKPGSIYSKIGMKNGDVIQKINGYEMNSPDKALEIYQKLKDATSISTDFQRRGQAKHFQYSIQ